MRILLFVLVVTTLFFSSCNICPKCKVGAPVINPPTVTANYPNTPFLFAVPTQGVRPIKWTAEGLPQGLQLDSETGFITGSVAEKGEYAVKITAENELGKSTSTLTINIGDLLGLTPLMGWSSWNTFTDKITDSLVRQIADSMVAIGMHDVGYQYVNIDDFWQLVDRDAYGNIQVDPKKFPNGMKSLIDYVHSKGLKVGLYSDAADRTCGGVCGSYGYEERDAKALAEWGVDLLKYDYCNAPEAKDTAIVRYTRMAKALRNTNRSIIFSVCEWGPREPWTWAASVGGNYWRTTWDIRNVWFQDKYTNHLNSIMQIVDINSQLADYATPGHFNDPDNLVVGIVPDTTSVVHNEGTKPTTIEEQRTNMSLWCLMASPLIASCDIRKMTISSKEILLNTELIAVNQDVFGKQGKKIRDDGDVEVFAKSLSDGSWAIGLLNRNDTSDKIIKVLWSEIGINGKKSVRNLINHTNLGDFSESFENSVKPHQCVVVKLYTK